MTAHETVTSLRERVLATVGRHVRPGDRVALVDYPNHTNVGDSAIWLGEIEALRLLGADVAYECEAHGHDAGAAARAIGPDGTVLLHGGGNFGDEWPGYQRLREGVIGAHRDHPVVVLPQTVRFNRGENEARAAAALRAHPRLTLLCRDERSAAAARSLAPAATVEACPDAAFALGRRPGRRPPAGEPLWLTRTDAERRGARLVPPGGEGRVIDWMAGEEGDLDARAGERLLRGVARQGGQRATRRRVAAAAARPLVRALHTGLARRRVQLGLDLVASAPVVVTDRLHAHILCLLAGVPHVLVDTGYGKLRAFVDAWTAGHPLLRLADSATAAAAAARDLASTPEAIHA
jgi:exopolysaccharide biosynthesis protein PssK